MPPETLRLFIAIELPPAALDALAQLQKRLKAYDQGHAVRWPTSSVIHLTLKFLGDAPTAQRGAIEETLKQAVAGHQAFTLSITGVGGFPSLDAARVIWAGVEGNVAALQALRDAVENTVAPLGFPTESRPFSPHLTLGRSRQDATSRALSSLGAKISEAKIGPLAALPVNGISLMRSELRPTGSIYTQLAYAELEQPAS